MSEEERLRRRRVIPNLREILKNLTDEEYQLTEEVFQSLIDEKVNESYEKNFGGEKTGKNQNPHKLP